jgi:anaerobic selenocysteine-containing dehydrogenase
MMRARYLPMLACFRSPWIHDVIVESPRGSMRGRAQIWTGIRPDTIFVPNGFGWEQVIGDSVGVPRYAEAANVLLDDRYFDTISGQQAYKCFACRIRKA